MAITDLHGAAAAASRTETRRRAHHQIAWRWHFYAGLFVIPFVVALALSGLAMMLLHGSSNKLGRAPDVVPAATAPLSAHDLAAAALAAVPGGRLDQFATPENPRRPAYLVVASPDDRNMVVAVDPYRGEVTAQYDKNGTLYALADNFHGTLLLGTLGDRLIEAAASLLILMIVTGLYLWLPGRGWSALIPDLRGGGRQAWRRLHGAIGTWISIILLGFCISGLSWSGIWGEKMVQAWSSFPLAKSASQWSSAATAGDGAAAHHDAAAGTAGAAEAAHHAAPIPAAPAPAAPTHADLGHGISAEVPWALAQVPMPTSDGISGVPGIEGPVTLDSVIGWARANGFDGQFRVSLPKTGTGVYTIAAEAMSEDGVTPSDDRTVHLDRYSGRVLADIGYADYGLMGKAMAWGIGLHMGLAGTWNLIFNIAYLALVLLLCASGVVMWWMRRPEGAGRLVAPPAPADAPVWRGGLVVVLLLALAFPMGGAALAAVIVLDLTLGRALPQLRQRFR